MLNSKQRAILRANANDIESILQIGKGGITPQVVAQANDALNARELIKISVLENAPVAVREGAQELAKRIDADLVQVIGGRAVLFRQNAKDSKFDI